MVDVRRAVPVPPNGDEAVRMRGVVGGSDSVIEEAVNWDRQEANNSKEKRRNRSCRKIALFASLVMALNFAAYGVWATFSPPVEKSSLSNTVTVDRQTYGRKSSPPASLTNRVKPSAAPRAEEVSASNTVTSEKTTDDSTESITAAQIEKAAVNPQKISSTNTVISKDTVCMNTVQGVKYVTDNTGAVCARGDVNHNSCCANKIDQLSCQGCNSVLKCCDSYEYCVSCCLKHHEHTGPVWAETLFRDCLKTCRTASKSIVHGNMYRHRLKHCYGEDPAENDLNRLPFDSVTAGKIVKLSRSVPCDVGCNQQTPPLLCVDELLQQVNTCNKLKDAFDCDGCSTHRAPEAPSFTRSGHQCSSSSLAVRKLDCAAFNHNRQRLCFCVTPNFL